MPLNFVGPKIEIFHDFWVFVLNSTPKSKNVEIMKVLQKCQHTEI